MHHCAGSAKAHTAQTGTAGQVTADGALTTLPAGATHGTLPIEYRWLNRTRHDAPIAVFLHEGLGSVAMWNEQARDVLPSLLDALGIDAAERARMWLIGHSDGGSIAFPNSLAGAIVIAPHGRASYRLITPSSARCRWRRSVCAGDSRIVSARSEFEARAYSCSTLNNWRSVQSSSSLCTLMFCSSQNTKFYSLSNGLTRRVT
ncbi:lipase family protein [Mycetohabitans sp. B8]|uniref:lipase family protein n=1 Tax=Mycetohabitans sp. B8 TaxID=2841845 RepID=UPI001F1F8E11|nr:lipase family protein [Mycetohabitans sp. B8]